MAIKPLKISLSLNLKGINPVITVCFVFLSVYGSDQKVFSSFGTSVNQENLS